MEEHWAEAYPTDVDPRSFTRLPTRTPCFRREADGHEFCLPHTYIVGLPKAGTSALWLKLRNHSSVVNLPDRKEYCFEDGWPSLDNIIQWSARMARPDQLGQDGDGLLLNACILMWGPAGTAYFRLLQDFFGVRDFKVLMLIRNYPDWLRAGWRFWCWSVLGDEGCEGPTFFRNKTLHDRSPKLWHELVSDPERLQKLPYTGYEFDKLYDKLRASVGDNLLAMAQEDMQSDSLRTLRAVEKHLGLAQHDYPPELLHALVNHHNAKPGPRSVLNCKEMAEVATSSSQAGSVDSGETDMLPETRALLDARWRDACEYLKRRAGLCFATCCDRAAEGLDPPPSLRSVGSRLAHGSICDERSRR